MLYLLIVLKYLFREAKNKFHTLLIEANSYNRSAQEEFHKNNDLINFSNKLKREQNNLENSYKICLDKINNLKDEYSKLMQMTEFQHQNLDQVLFVCILNNLLVISIKLNNKL